MKNWLIGKDPDAGKDWRQEKGTAENEMVGWHHWFDGLEFEQAPGIGDGHGSLACSNPWGHKQLDTTEQLNRTGMQQCFPVAQWVKNPPAMQETQETQVPSLGQEEPLKEEMAAHFSILSWEIPRTKKPGGLQSHGVAESETTEATQHAQTHHLVCNSSYQIKSMPK